GFPCCATRNVPYLSSAAGTDCSSVTPDNVGFLIGDTPFALAFGPSTWPEPWKSRAFVATHGAVTSWVGARIVAITIDPQTGMPQPGQSAQGEVDSGSMHDFANGWDDASHGHGRPAALEFSSDGR